MTDIENLPEHINSLSRKQWNRLFALLHKIERTEKFGEVKAGEKVKSEKPDSDSVIMPYMVSSEIVDKFINTVHELGLVPVFEWTDWEEGKSILRNPGPDFNFLDTITLCKLFTLIIRADRFNAGFLISQFQNGTITKIIRTLEYKLEL